MSSFMRAAGHRLTSLVRTSTRSACGSTPVSLRLSTSSTMWVSSSILDAAIIKDLGKLGGSPKRVPGWLAKGTGYGRQRTLATARRTFVRGWKAEFQRKGGNPLDDHPIGVP